MQYNSDSSGGRRVQGVNPAAPAFISSLSSARSVSSPSIDRTVASGSLSNQAYVPPTICRAVTPGPPTQTNMLAQGRSMWLLDQVSPYTPERSPMYSGKNAKTSTFSAPSMSMVVKASSPTHGELLTCYLNISTEVLLSNDADHADQLKSVKHLTCFYWHRYGKCNKADEVCLYAHHNTGHFAEEPMHMAPGRKH